MVPQSARFHVNVANDDDNARLCSSVPPGGGRICLW